MGTTEIIFNGEEELRSTVESAIAKRRHVVVFTLAKRLFPFLGREMSPQGVNVSEQATEWLRVESLSQLRAIVGGRFQNLKDRWVGAGFPLREHRGDRFAKADLNMEGWTELAVWISKQGFEARLSGEEDGTGLFEVRKTNSE